MRSFLAAIFVALCAAATLSGCQSTTAGGATGSSRNQLLLISAEDMNQAAAQAYKQELGKAQNAKKLNTNAKESRRVRQIASRLIAQVGVFRPDARNWKWEVNVINSNEVNAYCMPGGKIVVYTGIINQLKLTDAELAAVVGHEMAHALREHSREKVSQQLATQQTISIVSQLGGLSGVQENLGQTAGHYLLTLPFSRTMETESDVMGMELMARAGFNPQAAPNVWRKMARLNNSGGLEFASTHPSDERRIQNLEANLPKVMPLYEDTIKNVPRRKAPKKKKSSSS